MTQDERADLHEQAQDLAYLAITYADLHHELENSEWDETADRIGQEVIALVENRINEKRDELEVQATSTKET